MTGCSDSLHSDAHGQDKHIAAAAAAVVAIGYDCAD